MFIFKIISCSNPITIKESRWNFRLIPLKYIINKYIINKYIIFYIYIYIYNVL